MKRLLIAVLVLIVAVSAAWAQQKGDAAAGKTVYAKKCASCHGASGEGNPGIAKAMKVELRHLGSKEVQAKSDADLRKDTVEGIGKMKGVKGMSDKEVADVIAYMRSLAKK